jgi:hypothetical protein
MIEREERRAPARAARRRGVRRSAKATGPADAAFAADVGVLLDVEAVPWDRQPPCARLERVARERSGWAQLARALRGVNDPGADARKADAIRFCIDYGEGGAPHVVAALACSRLTFEAAP